MEKQESRINEIHSMANSNAKEFLMEFYKMENKSIVELEKISGTDIFHLHVKVMHELNNELMWHRNIPVPTQRLNRLDKIQLLPKSTRIILESIIRPEWEHQDGEEVKPKQLN